jgi:hypothetical protein
MQRDRSARLSSYFAVLSPLLLSFAAACGSSETGETNESADARREVSAEAEGSRDTGADARADATMDGPAETSATDVSFDAFDASAISDASADIAPAPDASLDVAIATDAPLDVSASDEAMPDGSHPDVVSSSDVAIDQDGGSATCTVVGVAGECIDTAVCSALEQHLSTPGHCAGPSNIACCTPYGTALCDPSIVRLPNNGHTTEAAGTGGCPSGMIPIDTFCIDRFEASLVRVDDGSSWSPYLNPATTAVRAVSVEGAIPQGYINGVQAAGACTNAGKRLCTDTEWLRACRGPNSNTFPYGNTRQAGVCNDARALHPAVQYFGTTDSSIFSKLDNACLDQLPAGLAPAGTYAGCVTDEGAYDMMGNLHEWTSDPAGTFRGGYYVDTQLNGQGCLYVTTAHNTLHWDYSTGFRCCAD